MSGNNNHTPGDWLDQYMQTIEFTPNVPVLPAQEPPLADLLAQYEVFPEPTRAGLDPRQNYLNSVPLPPEINSVHVPEAALNQQDTVDFISNDWYKQRFCPVCVVNFARAGDLDRHLWEIHPEYFHNVQRGAGFEGQPIRFTLAQEAINRMFVVYKANLDGFADFKNVDALFHSAQESAEAVLTQELAQRKNLRAIFTIIPLFSKTNPTNGQVEYAEEMKAIRSFDHILLDRSMIPRIWESAMNKIAVEVEDFIQNGSGWVLDRIEEFSIKISTFAPITGSSYMELPPLLKRKERVSLLNIRNDVINDEQDELKCFIWSILASPHFGGIPNGPEFQYLRRRDAKNVSTYKPHMSRLNLHGLNFPMTIQQIPKFEKQNKQIGITVIVYEIRENDYDDEQFDEEDEDSRGCSLVEPMVRNNRRFSEMQERIRERCFPGYTCPENRPIKIDLLLLVDNTIECDIRPDHFVLIKNLEALLHDRHNHDTKAICRNCLQNFNEDRTLDIHQRYCPALRLQRTTFPGKHNNICKFTQWKRTQLAPFVIYGDMECVLPENFEDQYGKTIKIQNHEPCGYSWIVVDHEGNRYSYNVYHTIDEKENVARRFLTEIIEECGRLKKIMENYQETARETMRVEEEKRVQLAGPGIPPNAVCCFCEEAFPHPNEQDKEILKAKKPVRHHSHLPPYFFQGWAHNSCNLNARMTTEIVVVMHNFSSYDSHFIVQASDKSIVEDLQIIPKSSEKFLSMLVNSHIRFIDSMAFFNKALAILAESLPKGDPRSFKITRSMFGVEDAEAIQADLRSYYQSVPTVSQCAAAMSDRISSGATCDDIWKAGLETFQSGLELNKLEDPSTIVTDIFKKHEVAFPRGDVNLLLQKQAYPYSYMTSVEKFMEKSLPPPEAFYNDLTNTHIEQEVYEHLKKVWKSFGLRNLGELHDLYVALDTSLLADIFESNRRTMIAHYGLDIVHYYSMPMVSKDALLKKTNAKLELLTDPTMYCWLETGIRGGLVSVGSLRAAEANNPYLQNEYNPNKPTSYIAFLDANNQYGWALCEPLPEKHFEWVEGDELLNILSQREYFIKSLGVDDSKGYAFEVDLEVPSHMHDWLNDYPPAPVKRLIQKEELPIHQQHKIDETNVLKTQRLIADLLPKKSMVCHYRNLQMWLHLGCKLTAIHKVLKFTQSRWMAPYIQFNTRMRQQASSDIEIEFWKGLNNCGFGKMIEKLRERQNIIPVLTETKGKRYNKKPTMQDFKIIHDGLVLLMMKKLAVKLNNPIAVGFACLELSKLVMFNFHYGYMKPKFGNAARLLYSDTDSFAYFVEYPRNWDIYDVFKQDEEYFDMSGYEPKDPVWGKFYNARHKKVLGKFKDEFSNCIPTHMVVAKPKMYIVRYIKQGMCNTSGNRIEEVKEKKKAKGIGKRAVENNLTMKHYENAIVGVQNEDISMKSIRSFAHVLHTVNCSKKSIGGAEVKRFCLDDKISTLAFGHKDIAIYFQ